MDPAIMAAVIAYFLAKKYDEERGQGSPGPASRPAGAPRGPLRELVSETWRNGVNDVKGAADPMWQRRQLARSKAAADRLKQIEDNWRKAGQQDKADAAKRERERLEEELEKLRKITEETEEAKRKQGPDSPDSPDSTPPTDPTDPAPSGGSPEPEQPDSEPTDVPPGDTPPTEEGADVPPTGGTDGPKQEQEPSAPRPGDPDFPVVVEDLRKRPGPVPEQRPELADARKPELEAPRPQLEAPDGPHDGELVEEPVNVPDTPAEIIEQDGGDWTPIGAGRNAREIGPAGQEAKEIEGAVLTVPKEGAGTDMATTGVSPNGDKVYGRLDAPRSAAPAAQPTGAINNVSAEGGSQAHIRYLEVYADALRSGLPKLEMIQATMGQFGHGAEVLQAMAIIREHTQQAAHGYQQLAAVLQHYDRTMREAKAATNNQAATNTTYYED